MALAYSRILLKVSGEALGDEGGRGISGQGLARLVDEIGDAYRAGVRLGIVVGAGNLWRGGKDAPDFDLGRSHQIGMVATVVNALVLAEALRVRGLPVKASSALEIREVVGQVDPGEAREELNSGSIVVFGGGTGNPFFTTDSAAALRAVQVGAEALFKATKVDGIYDADPVTNPEATKFPEINYDEVLRRDLKVMDASAFALCREHRIPIVVFNMTIPGALVRIARGEPLGSIVRA
jgi:uridylate kinase